MANSSSRLKPTSSKRSKTGKGLVGFSRLELLAMSFSSWRKWYGNFRPLALAETAATIAAKHRATQGITRQERDEAIQLFLQHCHTDYHLIPTHRIILERAIRLTQNHRLRGYDAVQLATALSTNEKLILGGLSPLIFVTADNDLIDAAQSEGLSTDNPNLYTNNENHA